MVALEELGGDEEAEPVRQERPSNVRSLPPRREAPRPAPQANRQNLDERVRADLNRQAFPTGNTQERRSPPPDTRSDSPMTENQRRFLLRFLAERGFEGKAALDALCRAAEVEDEGLIWIKLPTRVLRFGLVAFDDQAVPGSRSASELTCCPRVPVVDLGTITCVEFSSPPPERTMQ